jgi:hypothetical protein
MKGIKLLHLTTATLITLSMTSITFATAKFTTASFPSGFYVEGNVGSSKVTGKSYPGATRISNAGTGWNFDLGYKFNPFLGLEAGYTSYANVKVKNSQLTTAYQSQQFAYDVAVRGTVPLGTSGIELFAKLGVARIYSKLKSVDYAALNIDPGMTIDNTSSKHANGPYYSGGVALYFMPCFSANVQWAAVRGNKQTGNANLVSVGLGYLLG